MYTLMTRVRIDEWDRYGYETGRWYWSKWRILGDVRPGNVAATLESWRDLNAFAVRERGPQNTLREYRVVEGQVEDWDKWESARE